MVQVQAVVECLKSPETATAPGGAAARTLPYAGDLRVSRVTQSATEECLESGHS
jgi:hypothetical protein